MLRTSRATIDCDGTVRLTEPVELTRPFRALVTVLDTPAVADTLLLSEAALSDWNSPEEDEAWAHLDDLPDVGDDSDRSTAESSR